MDELKRTDPEIFDLIKQEERYEVDSVRLIASENYVSKAVLEATGSILTNKYSEGYPGRRYYEGQRNVDQIETLAVNRAKALFKVEHANVQPYSGSPANVAIYFALLKPGDTIMGLALPHGGHLTHGWPVSITGTFWKSAQYVVDRESHVVDFDQVRAMARKERPKIIVTGGTAYPRLWDFKSFSEIAKEVGALLLADISHVAGLIVGGVHPDPAPYADVIMTTTHKTLRGPRGAMIMCRAAIRRSYRQGGVPRTAGRSAQSHDGGDCGRVEGSLDAGVQGVRKESCKQCEDSRRRTARARIQPRLGRHRQSSDPGRSDQQKVIGKKGAKALDAAGIVCNYNTVPYDPRKPFSPSGLRLGTPAVTSRGMGDAEMRQIAKFMDEAIAHAGDEAALKRIAAAVTEMCRKFPAPGISFS